MLGALRVSLSASPFSMIPWLNSFTSGWHMLETERLISSIRSHPRSSVSHAGWISFCISLALMLDDTGIDILLAWLVLLFPTGSLASYLSQGILIKK